MIMIYFISLLKILLLHHILVMENLIALMLIYGFYFQAGMKDKLISSILHNNYISEVLRYPPFNFSQQS